MSPFRPLAGYLELRAGEEPRGRGRRRGGCGCMNRVTGTGPVPPRAKSMRASCGPGGAAAALAARTRRKSRRRDLRQRRPVTSTRGHCCNAITAAGAAPCERAPAARPVGEPPAANVIVAAESTAKVAAQAVRRLNIMAKLSGFGTERPVRRAHSRAPRTHAKGACDEAARRGREQQRRPTEGCRRRLRSVRCAAAARPAQRPPAAR